MCQREKNTPEGRFLITFLKNLLTYHPDAAAPWPALSWKRGRDPVDAMMDPHREHDSREGAALADPEPGRREGESEEARLESLGPDDPSI